MLKTKAKNKEELSWKKEKNPDKLQYDEEYYYVLKYESYLFSIIINSRTSSCGSLQLMFLNDIKGYNIPNIPKKERLNFFEYILSEYSSDRNHVYFIDRENGHLEKFFSDLGFKNVWSYYNGNTDNTVNTWCFNQWTENEYMNLNYEDEDIW